MSRLKFFFVWLFFSSFSLNYAESSTVDNKTCDLLSQIYEKCYLSSEEDKISTNPIECNRVSLEISMAVLKKTGNLNQKYIEASKIFGMICFEGCMHTKSFFSEIQKNCKNSDF